MTDVDLELLAVGSLGGGGGGGGELIFENLL